MPPKGRPRGTGRGRGGATASTRKKTTEPAEPAPPLEISNTESPETASAVTEVTQQTAAEAVSIPQNDSETAQSVASILESSESQPPPTEPTPQPTSASVPARKPVKRLDSLKDSNASSSRAASPSTRGSSSTRGKKPITRMPVFKGRRNEEERARLEREALEKERARRAERDAEARRANRGFHRGRGDRGRGDRAGRGRGGTYMGMGIGEAAVSGPFSSGRATVQKQRTPFRALASGSRAEIKREPHIKQDDDDERVSRSLGIAVKKEVEDGGYVSSDDDAQLGPKKDIDTIQISSDEEDPEMPDRKSRERSTPMLLPVRIARKEHHDRIVGINTEASSATSAKLLQQAETTGEIPSAGAIESSTRKGKGKAKDVEITGVRRPYRGMWQDTDDRNDGVKIKEEPLDDDEDAAVPFPSDAAILAGNSATENQALKNPPSSPETEKKPKPRIRRGPLAAEPALQTEEDRGEWERLQASLAQVREELGPVSTLAVAAQTQTQDQEGDVVVKDGPTATEPKQTRSVRDDHVYLFQLPPIIPDLLPPAIKKECSDSSEQKPPIASSNTEQTPIKIEEGEKPAPTAVPDGPHFASGRVGKLRVHESGRTTINWGGTSFELKLGQAVSFLQEIVYTKITPEAERVTPDDGGEAVAFGPVKGKFVIVPDWSEMVG